MTELKFDEKGLTPVIVQDAETNEVLTLAYMNQESYELTLKDQLMTFYSRSRKELWRKGETSGNYQHLVSLKLDCDQDALVAKVKKDGPACHTGAESCFNEVLYGEDTQATIDTLYELIKGRKEIPQEGSYTSYLFEKGIEKILKKVGEESTEVVIGAMKEDYNETVFEISDLVYHILVLMVEMGIDLSQVRQELENRHVVDKKVKQERMQ
ncbi:MULTISPECIES: bifunctional phosphoribosyl-AMP cyclohydrolase/phosphoribosyl-ATP diphosphatase HisIE [Enterococcus]|uniref:bifunctional phosphoribosyl-AMP cyclohydrolase/phosphoribosyl-ATP diphosphatase HisIE n=1 Tax=Enterococcus TaxID=1350 RepID=UPI0010CA295A|nr:bifunctional phosphoribosyl-AMP cyclohydrolase/phosphoribosyl-ATP diphosphatase HisIE [Enterococcus avium]MDT2460557.1 bifunctional phosphoribosyl-AMP cyclohydrolase/phosphoribosyl-ATP diphosphatase HisIE [Enterococcus avium]MDU2213622.1 bifunctional phosphoribosyl-AMP cyclohydrolase/phosphoribosyl-ATP diphosphatase HisIE [Enterococcus avium]MDU6619900.1 bifunctional phosphoribosyl-AMP cyclohydrolase/phosphoribosyl-ATP diphosphatase HisIE [Enterococcus avium]MZJ57870.1 bifunctional phosphori